jgi:hypothetical protein
VYRVFAPYSPSYPFSPHLWDSGVESYGLNMKCSLIFSWLGFRKTLLWNAVRFHLHCLKLTQIYPSHRAITTLESGKLSLSVHKTAISGHF